MRILVTGASGWIGSATTTALLESGHEVLGLARTEEGLARVASLGAEPVRGNLDDVPGLRAAAERSEGVVHLAYNHDFSQMGDAARTDRAAIQAFGDVLAGSGRPLLIASGTLGLASGRPGTERDTPDPAVHPRIANAAYTLGLAERGVRSLVVRFAPTVHGEGDHGFVAVLAQIAREKGVAAYVADGANRWPAVHRADAAELVRLAVDSAPAGSVLHAVAEEGVPARDIAQALGDSIGVPTESIPVERVEEHFGWIGMFFAADAPATSEVTRELLGWKPSNPTLLEDIASGHYPGR